MKSCYTLILNAHFFVVNYFTIKISEKTERLCGVILANFYSQLYF